MCRRVDLKRTTLLHGETCKSIQSAIHVLNISRIQIAISHAISQIESRTLLVVTTGNLEQVALEFFAERVTDNLSKNPNQPFVPAHFFAVHV